MQDRFKAHYTDETMVMEASLYDLEKDPDETNNLAGRYPDIVQQLLQYADQARQTLGDKDRPSPYRRPAGMVTEIIEIK